MAPRRACKPSRRSSAGASTPSAAAVGGACSCPYAGITARTIAAFASGSTFIYFLQPSLTTVVVAGAFLLSVPAGRPLAERLAHDFVPLEPEILRIPAVKRVFVRITLLWAFVNLANAVLSVALLMSQPVGAFVAAKTVMGFILVIGAVGDGQRPRGMGLIRVYCRCTVGKPAPWQKA